MILKEDQKMSKKIDKALNTSSEVVEVEATDIPENGGAKRKDQLAKVDIDKDYDLKGFLILFFNPYSYNFHPKLKRPFLI